MAEKTIFRKGEHSVEICECFKMVGDKIMNFYIEETDQYFSNGKRAIRAAKDLLLKKSLTEYRYNQRKIQERKQRGANQVVRVFKCINETEIYVKRWEGIIYLETKKRLLSELHEKLDALCVRYGFKNEHEAVGFLERMKKW